MRAAVVQSNIILSPLALASTPGVPPGGPSRAYRWTGRNTTPMAVPSWISGHTIVWQGWVYREYGVSEIILYTRRDSPTSSGEFLTSMELGSTPIGVWSPFKYVGIPKQPYLFLYYQVNFDPAADSNAIWFGDWTVSVL